jgi:hypothetical protein
MKSGMSDLRRADIKFIENKYEISMYVGYELIKKEYVSSSFEARDIAEQFICDYGNSKPELLNE